jgi:small ligand-binding sensory domain FIST
MPFAAQLSTHETCRQAMDDICSDISAQLGGASPDLAVAFVSHDLARQYSRIAETLSEGLGAKTLIGCTGESIVGGSREIEQGPALSVWCGVMPGAAITPFHVTFERTPDGIVCLGLPEGDEPTSAGSTVLFLADPFTCGVDAFKARLDDDLPGAPVLGGMASGGAGPGKNHLFLGTERVAGGGVGVVLRGGPRVHSITSQGCRPIGETFVVTRAEQNVLFELGGRPALQRLQDVFGNLSVEDRELVRQGLHVGSVINEYQDAFRRGDFLISNVVGADHESGAIAIGNPIRTGQTVQFHVRDAATADEDLRHLLTEWQASHPVRPAGALLFTCNGRGTRLFAAPHHDASVVQELCGPIPLAGLFAQGEFGPVAGRNYIHGYTASVALFTEE